jgi:WD40 repeat protein
MNRIPRPLNKPVWLLFTLGLAVACLMQPIRADSSSFCPAYWQQGSLQLRLFSPGGQETAATLPGFVKVFQSLWFSPDGKVIYGRAMSAPSGQRTGITKIEFKPVRQSIVPGSDGLEAWHLTVSPSSGKIFVAGWTESRGRRGECGYFVIAPSSGAVQTLRAGAALDCSHGPGPISPDGRRAVISSGKQLGLLDLESGGVEIIKGVNEADSCSWSPDGRLLACTGAGKIAVVDIETSRVRKIGGSGNGRAEWSPDGRTLLVIRSQLSCLPTLYGDSLATIDVETGKSRWVESSHCSVTGGSYYGWVDREAMQ